MEEKYLYNGKVYSRSQLERLANQSGVSFGEYINGIGATLYNEPQKTTKNKGTYSYNGKDYSASQLQSLADESGVGFDEYINGIGAKKPTLVS